MLSSAEVNDLVRTVLPRGGLVVSLIKVCMDESLADKTCPYLCVAGYAFSASKGTQFNKEWSAYLSRKGLEYFRMSDCAHLSGQFEGWTHDEADIVARSLIERLKRQTMFGFGVTLHQAEYERLLQGRAGLPSAYAFACFGALNLLRRWIERKHYSGQIAYFFEAGHPREADARLFLDDVFSYEKHKTAYAHISHTFIAKRDMPALQAGDVLAWHTTKRYKNEMIGRPIRRDFQALIRPVDILMEYTPMEVAATLTALQNSGMIADPISALAFLREQSSQ